MIKSCQCYQENVGAYLPLYLRAAFLCFKKTLETTNGLYVSYCISKCNIPNLSFFVFSMFYTIKRTFLANYVLTIVSEDALIACSIITFYKYLMCVNQVGYPE